MATFSVPATSDFLLDSLSPDTNMSGATTIITGWTSSGSRIRRGVIEFPISTINTDASLVRLDLWLMATPFAGPWNIRFTALDLSGGNIVSTEATWNRRSAATAWTTPGGDSNALGVSGIVATGPVTGEAGKLKTYDLTAMIVALRALGETRAFIRIRADDESGANKTFSFATNENGTNPGPQLTVSQPEHATIVHRHRRRGINYRVR